MNPPMTPPAAKSAAKILHDARWMACLTQAQVAARAGVSQQTVAKYESGVRQPSVTMLGRLVSGCGVELTWRLMPAPGLDDDATRLLLELSPLERLKPELAMSLAQLVRAARGLDMVIGGKTAARMLGAPVRAFELEIWVDEAVNLDALNESLKRAAVVYVSPTGQEGPADLTREQLMYGWPLVSPLADLHLRGIPGFRLVREQASIVELPGEHFEFLLAAIDDCPRWWGDRDPDHLALQRAIRARGGV
jgi:transcriptional regulator with XRE-family HTH domain